MNKFADEIAEIDQQIVRLKAQLDVLCTTRKRSQEIGSNKLLGMLAEYLPGSLMSVCLEYVNEKFCEHCDDWFPRSTTCVCREKAEAVRYLSRCPRLRILRTPVENFADVEFVDAEDIDVWNYWNRKAIGLIAQKKLCSKIWFVCFPDYAREYDRPLIDGFALFWSRSASQAALQIAFQRK